MCSISKGAAAKLIQYFLSYFPSLCVLRSWQFQDVDARAAKNYEGEAWETRENAGEKNCISLSFPRLASLIFIPPPHGHIA